LTSVSPTPKASVDVHIERLCMTFGKRLLFVFIVSAFMVLSVTAQQPRVYTRADFINIDGGNLSSRVDRAVKQFKGSNQGTAVWLAYDFPQIEGVSIGPYSGMIYRDDDGIRLDRSEKPADAAVFLLADAAGDRPVFKRVTTLNLNEPYKFEDKPVYWLGNVDANESIALLDSIRKENQTNVPIASSALRAIAIHDSARTVPLLKEAALKETNLDIQRAAVSALPRTGKTESVAALSDIYRTVTVDPLKEEVIAALGRSSERSAADKLLEIARTDSNASLRKAAVRRLSTRMSAKVN
jgi:hypothetical protein